jgi:hypothetical protein
MDMLLWNLYVSDLVWHNAVHNFYICSTNLKLRDTENNFNIIFFIDLLII